MSTRKKNLFFLGSEPDLENFFKLCQKLRLIILIKSCPLQGDLVFKLNPGPTDDRFSIHTPASGTARHASMSNRTNNHSYLTIVNRSLQTKHPNTLSMVNNTTFRIPVVTSSIRSRQPKRSRHRENLTPVLRTSDAAVQNSSPTELNFCLLNAQSLNNKAGEFIDLICEYKPDVVALTETWFCPTESASRTLCTPVGYKLLDHPRTSPSGGGTGVLFRENLTVKKGDAAELRSFEFSEWEIKAETDRIHLIIMYRTPYSEAHPVTTSVFLEEFSTFLESAVFCTNHLLITGDFNIHMDVADDPDATAMRGLLESTGWLKAAC